MPSPPDNRIQIADAGAAQTVTSETLVQLDGSASGDPAGDLIAFTWLQEAGRTVILHDAETAAPFFVAPNVSAPDVLEFSLVIRDSKGAATLPKAVRVSVLPQ